MHNQEYLDVWNKIGTCRMGEKAMMWPFLEIEESGTNVPILVYPPGTFFMKNSSTEVFV